MRTSQTASQMLTASIAVAMLAGCSGDNAPTGGTLPLSPQTARQQGFVNPQVTAKKVVFASFPESNIVDIFLQRGKNRLVGQITGLSQPLGLATDVAGDLYIANQSSPTVPVYAPPYTGAPKLILDATGYLPQDVGVSRSGVVAVANFCNHSGCTEYSISFYAKNDTEPCVTVSVPTPGVVAGVAFDAKENLFMAGENGANDFLGEIKGGCKAKKTKLLTTTNTLGHLSGVQIDKANRIAILGLDTSVVYTYNHPKGGSLGSPVSTTTLSGSSGAFSFVFLASGRDLYANIHLASLSEYRYPAGGAPVNSIPASRAGGVAVTPPLVP